MRNWNIVEYVLIAVIFWCFIKAMLEDARWQRVHRYLWWISGTAGLGLLFLHWEIFLHAAGDLVFFAMVQFFLFSKLYGRADCHAFQVCSMVLGAYGGTLKIYLFHMLFTIIMLGLVQICRRNVNKKGDLKEPVALLPYLMPAFFLTWGSLVTMNR